MKEKLINKKVIIPIVAIILIIAIVCGGYFLTLHFMKNSALKQVDIIFNAIKSGDEETLKQYLDEENTTQDEESTNEETKEMQKIMLSNLNYELISSDISLKECVVKLNISNKDLNKVFSNYMQKAFSLAFSQAFGKITEEEMNEQMKQYLQEQYNSDEIETVTSELTITMIRQNGKWNMNTDNEQLINAILPGYKGLMETLNNIQ